MLLIRLGKHLSDYAGERDDRKTSFFKAIVESGREGWTADLIAAALDANPGSPHLQAFALKIGLNAVPQQEQTNLEKVVRESSLFHDADVFLEEFARRVNWTCRIYLPDGGGTGVLVGPDLVLTNYHVVEDVIAGKVPPNKITCIFDFKKLRDGSQISSGRRVELANEWCVAWRPYSVEDTRRCGGAPQDEALDYALLRLNTAVGNQPLGPKGPADATARKRGWCVLRHHPPSVEKSDPLIVLQHPLLKGKNSPEPTQLSIGSVLDLLFEGRRLRHDARTLSGSSGSPCFNANLDMVALHHAGDPVTEWEQAEWNQAIPLGHIVADLNGRSDLAERAVEAFWDVEPQDD